jgi:hypothetical protein
MRDIRRIAGIICTPADFCHSADPMKLWTPSFILLVALCSLTVFGDQPLAPPSLRTECSPSGAICAEMDPERGTTVFRRANGEHDVLWRMPGWFRVAFVADDGKHLVTGYDGSNLLAGRDPNEAMLHFWNEGQLLHSVSLGQLLPDLSRLKRTVSHWHWGNYVGFDQNGHIVVETVDGKRHRFNVSTGDSEY